MLRATLAQPRVKFLLGLIGIGIYGVGTSISTSLGYLFQPFSVLFPVARWFILFHFYGLHQSYKSALRILFLVGIGTVLTEPSYKRRASSEKGANPRLW